jgi:hypothetical protein
MAKMLAFIQIRSIMSRFFIFGGICFLSGVLCSPNSPGGNQANEADPVFGADIDSAYVATFYDADSTEISFPLNQLLVMGDTTIVNPKIMDSIAKELKTKLVGQVPSFGIYQIQTDSKTIEELNAKGEEFSRIGQIQAVTYNLILQSSIAGSNSCPPCSCTDDVCNLNPALPKACSQVYENICYQAMCVLMDRVTRENKLNKVKVGLIDKGIDLSWVNQFDNLNYYSMDGTRNFQFSNTDNWHGTRVAGIIAADNFDGSINGIASRALGDKLEMAISINYLPEAKMLPPGLHGKKLLGTFHVFENAVCAVRQKIEIVNISQTNACKFTKIDKLIFFFDWAKILEQMMEILQDRLLFILSAPNREIELTDENYPLAKGYPNVIMVGGATAADPMKRRSGKDGSAYGNKIDISAPSDNILIVDPQENVMEMTHGNSIAAPMVTSLAVILKSIKPDLKPSEIKKYIKEHSSPGDLALGGRFLNLCLPIEQLLIDMNYSQSILDVVDADHNKDADLSGFVYSRLCGVSKITISKVGTFTYPTSSDEYFTLGSITPQGIINFTFNKGATDSNTFIIYLGEKEFLKKKIKFVDPNQSSDSGIGGIPGLLPSTAILLFYNYVFIAASAISGEILINRCRILERSVDIKDMVQKIAMIEIEGSMNGTMRILDKDGFFYPTFEGTFIIPFLIKDLAGNSPLEGYCDSNCSKN